PGYFTTMGLRLRAGRRFTDADTMTSPEVVVVNRSFAAAYLGPQPLGAVLPNLGMCRGDRDRWEVVGVVDDMRQGSLGAADSVRFGGVGDPPQPEIFLPHRQVGCPNVAPEPVVIIRTAGDPAQSIGALRAALREIAPTLALDSVMTMDDRVTASLAKP